MIVDSSVIIAILKGEPEAAAFAGQIRGAGYARISAANYVEASIVVERVGDKRLSELFDSFFARTGIVIEPVTAEQAVVAREAYLRFGKGSGSAARLNFGDCFAYALSRVTGEPLLFKGDDFTHTDVVAAGSGVF